MEPKGSTAVVGFFVLIFGVGIVATVLWLGGFGRGAKDTYLVYMPESVAGLTIDAPVKFRGVDVGAVKSLGLRKEDPETVVLTLEVDPATPIRVDTRATLEYQGFTGLAFVKLIGGDRNSPELKRKPGQPHPVIESSPSILLRFDESSTKLIASLTATSNRVSEMLGDEELAHGSRSLANLERVTSMLARRTEELDATAVDAARLMANTAAVSESLPQFLQSMEGLVEEWSATSREVREVAAEGRIEVSRAAGKVAGDAQALTTDLRRLLVRVDRLVTQLESDPTLLIYGPAVSRPGPGE